MLSTIEDAKTRLPLREVARSLGLEVPERDGQLFRCWFADTRHANGDRVPSFNLYKDRYKCFGCGAQGDAVDLLAEVLGLDLPEAAREYKRRAGLIEEAPPVVIRPKEEAPPTWPDFRNGTNAELEALATLREGLSPHGLALAQGMGVLRFGQVCGRGCWIVTDEGRRIVEGRRMDGLLFFSKQKAHCLPGSRKAWPVGLLPRHSNPALFRHLLLCEGGPDLLAGFHFAERFGALTWLPVAMLGRSCRIAPEALAIMAGRHVRIVPHLDPDGGGFKAAEAWADELRQAGATVDFFKLPEGLRRKDGKAVKDLCDAANLPERDAGHVADLFKMPDSIEAEATVENSPSSPWLTSVVHCKRSAHDVYIGRPSKWGNPFEIGRDGDRETVIRKYREWLPNQPELMAALPELKGKTLGCWCAPKACHGDILFELANGVSKSSPPEGTLFKL
jgi:hypothetical protein